MHGAKSGLVLSEKSHDAGMTSRQPLDLKDGLTLLDNRAVVANASTTELTIAGFVAAGDAKQVDKAFDKLRPR